MKPPEQPNSEDHIFITKGTQENLGRMFHIQIINSYNFLVGELKTKPTLTVNADMYCRDVLFLLETVDNLWKALKEKDDETT